MQGAEAQHIPTSYGTSKPGLFMMSVSKHRMVLWLKPLATFRRLRGQQTVEEDRSFPVPPRWGSSHFLPLPRTYVLGYRMPPLQGWWVVLPPLSSYPMSSPDSKFASRFGGHSHVVHESFR